MRKISRMEYYLLLLLSGSANNEIAIVGPEFALWWTGDDWWWSELDVWCGVLLTGEGEWVECLMDAGEDGLDIPWKWKGNFSLRSMLKHAWNNYQRFAMNLDRNFLSDYDTKPIVPMVLMKAISDYDSLCCYKNESCNLLIEHLIKKSTQSKHYRSCKSWTYLNACLRGVNGDPSLICPKFKQFWPFTLHVSKRFLGGSTVSTTSFRGLIASSSSSRAGRLRFRSNNKK